MMTMEEKKNTCRNSNHQNVCLLLVDGSQSHYPRGPGDVSILLRKTAGCQDNIQLSLCLIKHPYIKNVDNAFLTLTLDDAEPLA